MRKLLSRLLNSLLNLCSMMADKCGLYLPPQEPDTCPICFGSKLMPCGEVWITCPRCYGRGKIEIECNEDKQGKTISSEVVGSKDVPS